jgi:hypothetical protein
VWPTSSLPGCLVGAYTRVVRMTWLLMVVGGLLAAAGNTAAQAPAPMDARKVVVMLDSVAANVAPQLAGHAGPSDDVGLPEHG